MDRVRSYPCEPGSAPEFGDGKRNSREGRERKKGKRQRHVSLRFAHATLPDLEELRVL